jgi:rhamnulokinase
MAADACERPVLAGPVEATAIGNVMMQAIAAGAVRDVGQAREVIRDSTELASYEPRRDERWDAAARLIDQPKP